MSAGDDLPRSMAAGATIQHRLAPLDQPHMGALTRYVRNLRAQGVGFVPDFDPLDGGDQARLLFLQEKPGPKTFPPMGSGFISRDNNDATAENTFRFMVQSGIPRSAVILWNTIPWWNGTVGFTPLERQRGLAEIPQLLRLLPKLLGVVLVGKVAAVADPLVAGRGLHIFHSAHTSTQSRNGPASRFDWVRIPEVWRAAWLAVA